MNWLNGCAWNWTLAWLGVQTLVESKLSFFLPNFIWHECERLEETLAEWAAK